MSLVQNRPQLNKSKLAKFRAAFALDNLSDKAQAITAAIGQSSANALDQRITGAAPEDKALIQELLHYSHKQTKGSDKQERASRRALMGSVLSGGLDLDAAVELRKVIDTVPAKDLTALLQDLGKPGTFPPGVLAVHLLKAQRPDADKRYAALKSTLLGFPADPGRAGRNESTAGGVTIGRDDQGKLKIVNQALSLLPFQVPDANKNLTTQKIQQLKGIFDTVADTNYSRQGVPLEVLNTMRTQNRQRRKSKSKMTLKEAMEQTDISGLDIAQKYGSGDCLVLGDKLVRRFQEAGIDAKLVGYNNSGLTRQRCGNGEVKDPKNSGLLTDGITHTDIVVPYTDATGKERVLAITPGMGAEDKWFKDYSREEFYNAQPPAVTPGDRVIGADGADIDTSKVQKDQLKFLTNVQLTNNKPTDPAHSKQVCGIDIMAGKIYLNGEGSKVFDGPRASEEGAVSLDLKAMLTNPREEVTMKVWNAQSNGYEDRQMPKSDALVATLMAIGKQFGQPNDFADNILTLAENLDEWRSDVIAPEIADLHT